MPTLPEIAAAPETAEIKVNLFQK